MACRNHVERVGWNAVAVPHTGDKTAQLCPRGLIQLYAGEYGLKYRSAFSRPRNECAAIATEVIDQTAQRLDESVGLVNRVHGAGEYAEAYARIHRTTVDAMRFYDEALASIGAV